MDPQNPSSNPMLSKASGSTSLPALASSAKSTRDDDPDLASATRADAALEKILAHLGEGRYGVAQQLAKAAAARFPDQRRVRKMDRALNQQRVRTRPASGRDTTEEFNWLKSPPESAHGKWVALVGSEVVAASESAKDLVESLRSKDLPKSALVVRVG